ncbi:TKL family protein kinase [Trichomonas vaginalis G3]|uniref:TKL family protein kinase n=1 Tax=Trichomonas vaginalis (strain ATCC PRA-98 / G3) TaxID=412133 RepID=A2DVE5_TRIV3|nr:protein kinase protein [Trichomonas vaginalis G3]EAY15624.1 TKL family protein kinase [Trichomonas vaginalis G3]KAI5530230.1 protein kinase protein [Trichomonas vaginalis G3]|eukprot:XP_001327847.1 TKL family protein kinase [Trichomonas vaginalis G3]
MRFPPESPTPLQIQKLRELLKLINDLRQMFLYLDANLFVEFITSADSGYVKAFVENFRKEFNNLCSFFPFLRPEPLTSEPAQECTDDRSDVQDIIQRISAALRQANLPPEVANCFNQRLNEYQNAMMALNASMVNSNIMTKNLNGVMLRQRLELPEKFYLPKNDFVIKKKIGSGGFADVHEGIQQSTQKVVAIKILHSTEMSETVFTSFKREIEIQASLSNFAILELVGVCLEAPFYIATEFMPKDCLFKRLHLQSKLKPTQRTIIALGCAIGLAYMHKHNYIHRDIKSLNILLDADDFPKICDFGMSRTLAKSKELMSGGVGTAQWEAPEVINNMQYNEKADVYSYGILLWEILTSDFPFRGLSQVQVAMNVVGNAIRPVIPNVAPPKITKMIKLCWDQEASRRPSMEQVARAIACGEVVFPGTHMPTVEAYLARFGDDPIVNAIKNANNKETPSVPSFPRHPSMAEPLPSAPSSRLRQQRSMTKYEKKASHRSEGPKTHSPPNEVRILNLVDPRRPNPALIPGIIELLKGKEQEQVITMLVEMANTPEWCTSIKDSEIIPTLTGILNTTQNPTLATKIYSIFVKFDKNQVPLNSAYASIFSSFQRLGNTSMADVLQLIISAMQHGIEPPTVEGFMVKLAAFLQAGNMNCRIITVSILQQLIMKSNFLQQFSVIFLPAIANLIPGGEILSQTIEIIYFLITKGGLSKEFVEANGFLTILSLILPTDTTTPQLNQQDKQKAFAIFGNLVKVQVNDENLNKFADMLQYVLKSITDFNDLCVFVAATAFSFSKHDLSPVILVKYADFIKSLYTIEDQRVVLIALKITYFFLQHNETRKVFLDSGAALTKLLNPANEAIAAITASCMIQFYASLDNEKYLELLNQELFTFLYTALMTENSLAPYALRLFGTISLTYDGAAFLQSNSIPQLAGNFMMSSTPELKLLGYQAFTAFVVTYPMSDTALAATQVATQSLNDSTLMPYPLLMISSLIVCPAAAVNIAPNIGCLVKLLDTDASQTKLVLQALTKVFGTLEARDYFSDTEALVSLFNKAGDYVGTSDWWTLVELIDMATGTSVGLNAVAQSNVATVLKQAMTMKNITRKQKWHINRVFVRLECST